MSIAALDVTLPHPLPSCPNAQVLLFAMRRMGAHGLADARGAHALFTAFGRDFRRPLTLLRALMAEVAASATVSIAIAPCCCGAETRPEAARLLLGDLLGVARADGVLASAAAVAVAFADAGRPVTGWA